MDGFWLFSKGLHAHEALLWVRAAAARTSLQGTRQARATLTCAFSSISKSEGALVESGMSNRLASVVLRSALELPAASAQLSDLEFHQKRLAPAQRVQRSSI